MDKVVLSEISLVHGEVKTPKGFEIDHKEIKNSIISSYLKKDRASDNKKDFSYDDYKIDFSQKMQWLLDYIRDHFNEKYRRSLVSKIVFGNVYAPSEVSLCRNNVDPVDLRHSADYTLIYIVDCGEKSSELVIEYDNNRRKGRTWHVPIKNNHFYLFPSTQKYFFTANKSKQLNVILTVTYEYI